MRVHAAICLLLFVSAQSAAAADEDVQLWLPVTWTASLTGPFQGFFEVQPRIGDDISDVTQLILRTAFGYRFAPDWSGWLGYAWSPTLSPSYKDENRIFQQLLFARSYPVARVTSRTRLEERWIEGVSGTSVRLRTMLRGLFPICEDQRWAPVVQDEIYFNLNTAAANAPPAGFDQNRLFLGVNRIINQWMSVDFGYMLQIVNTAEPGFPNRINQILLLQLSLNT